jgi:3-dehydroquinate dehydratase-1
MGQITKVDIYTLGHAHVDPPATFFEKCFNELGLPYNHFHIEQLSEGLLEAITNQPRFGGAIVHPPLHQKPAFLTCTDAATTTSVIDTLTISKGFVYGENASAKRIRTCLICDYAPSAFLDQAVVLIANTFNESSSAIYALRQLKCGSIYTVGFEAPPGIYENVVHCQSLGFIEQSSASPFVVISAIPSEHSQLVTPLLRLITKHPQIRRKGRAFLDLANGFSRGIPADVAASGEWTIVSTAEIAAWTLVEKLKILLGQSIPYDFVRMASLRGMY